MEPQWNDLMGGRTFITDLGVERHVELDGVDTTVGRYAVWAPIRGCDRHQVIEVGQTLEVLMDKYHIPAERVCSLG